MNNVSKIADNIVSKPQKRKFDLGSGVEGTIKETPDKMGFEISVAGSFRSGNDIDKTIKDLQKAWEQIDIDL